MPTATSDALIPLCLKEEGYSCAGNMDMAHHHADGTVHAHPRGADLHAHNHDGSPTPFEGRAPFGYRPPPSLSPRPPTRRLAYALGRPCTFRVSQAYVFLSLSLFLAASLPLSVSRDLSLPSTCRQPRAPSAPALSPCMDPHPRSPPSLSFAHNRIPGARGHVDDRAHPLHCTGALRSLGLAQPPRTMLGPYAQHGLSLKRSVWQGPVRARPAARGRGGVDLRAPRLRNLPPVVAPR